MLASTTTPYCEECRQRLASGAEEIGGWMLLPLLNLFVQPLTVLYTFFNSTGAIELLRSSRITSASRAVIWFEVIALVALTGFDLFALMQFLRRRKSTPTLMIVFMSALIAYRVVDVFAAGYPLGREPDFGSLVRGLIPGIWIVYFVKSERVKRTFVL